MIEQWRCWHLDVLALYTHMSWRNYVVYFKQKQTSGSNTPSSCGVLHICCLTAEIRAAIAFFAPWNFGWLEAFVEMLVHAVSNHLDMMICHLCNDDGKKSTPGCGVYALLLPLVAWDCIWCFGAGGVWASRQLGSETPWKNRQKSYSCLKPSRGWTDYTNDLFFLLRSSRLWQRHIENICRLGAKVSIGHVMWSLKTLAWWMFSPQMLSIEFYVFMVSWNSSSLYSLNQMEYLNTLG